MLVQPTLRDVLLLGGAVAPGNTHAARISSGNYLIRAATSMANVNIAGDQTIQFWVRFNSLPASGTGAWIYGIHSATTSWRHMSIHMINVGGQHRIRAFYYDPSLSNTIVYWVWTPSLMTWYHVGIAIDPVASPATNEFIFVRDASDQGPPVIEVDPASSSMRLATAGDFQIGGFGGNIWPLDGWVDDVRFYDKARSEAEIAADYNVEVSGGAADLQQYSKMNNDFTDESANGYDWSTVGSPTFITTPLPF